MTDKPGVSRGVVVVALMALSKKEFFRRLLEDPEAALTDVRADLDLTDDDLEEVTSLITEARERLGPKQALDLWDGWRATGVWGGGRGGWVTRGGWIDHH